MNCIEFKKSNLIHLTRPRVAITKPFQLLDVLPGCRCSPRCWLNKLKEIIVESLPEKKGHADDAQQ